MQKLVFFCLLFFLFSVATQAQLTINITAIPEDTPEEASIFIAGNFNGWDPGDSEYVLEETANGIYTIQLNIAPTNMLFKFTRGSWETVEGNENGMFLPDRTYSYSGGTDEINLTILTWEDIDSGGNSTAAENVSILSEDFYIPQLDRNRKIWLYLPPDYENSTKSYPVLYMHDGQNLFDAQTSFAGEWQVDETLNTLFEQGDYGIIVVGIENGGASRLDEYSPWENPQYGGGEGTAYIDFIRNTLKPYIDENYRTISGPKYTGIMGSSMGGLISFYGAIEHQEVFGKAGCLSTSFWFADEVYEHLSATGKEEEMRIYMLAGDGEVSGSVNMVEDMYRMQDSLFAVGFSAEESFAINHSDGQHSEWYWAREFGEVYLWLFGDLNTATADLSVSNRIKLFPNPTKDSIRFELDAENNQAEQIYIRLLDASGRVVIPKSNASSEGSISVQGIPTGVYLVEFFEKEKWLSTQRLIIAE